MVFTKSRRTPYPSACDPKRGGKRTLTSLKSPNLRSDEETFAPIQVSSQSPQTFAQVPLFRLKLLYSVRKGGNRRRNTGTNRKRAGVKPTLPYDTSLLPLCYPPSFATVKAGKGAEKQGNERRFWNPSRFFSGVFWLILSLLCYRKREPSDAQMPD